MAIPKKCHSKIGIVLVTIYFVVAGVIIMLWLIPPPGGRLLCGSDFWGLAGGHHCSPDYIFDPSHKFLDALLFSFPYIPSILLDIAFGNISEPILYTRGEAFYYSFGEYLAARFPIWILIITLNCLLIYYFGLLITRLRGGNDEVIDLAKNRNSPEA